MSMTQFCTPESSNLGLGYFGKVDVSEHHNPNDQPCCRPAGCPAFQRPRLHTYPGILADPREYYIVFQREQY